MGSEFNLIEIEKEILDFWEKNKIYPKAKEKNKGKKSFYFLDGPPYTSGKIHLGIAWNKSLKDSVLRYKRMQGFDVWDRAGYDMHGLPTENKTMDKLKLKSKDDIPKFGVEKFIKECKKLSIDNMEMMNKDFTRLGIWMDFKNPYKSIENSFMEGEWWLIKKAHENKRLYEGKKTMQWCTHCATALAKHELEYKNITDQSIFVKFKIAGKKDEYLVIWTTTPWTLAFNLAVMVHPELEYLKVKVDNEFWIVAKGLAAVFIQGVVNKKFEIIEEFKGAALKGLKYVHPWENEIPFHEIRSNKLHTVILSEEYVDLSAGTGLVHCAPGCGPEDYEVGHREGLPAFNNISEEGIFPETMGKFMDLTARKDDKKFVEALGANLIATTEVEHEYAHCWRCRKPVVFRTTKQWFFKVEDLIEDMRKLNQKVFWQPDWAGSSWFDSWLNNLRDNGITRQRVWGTPVPIWRCNECDNYVVIGSVKELKKYAKDVPEDLHRPYIDEVLFKCEKCNGVMSRIPDILDVWIDAGTTSWTCLDYPQRDDLFKKLWPAEFILEGKDQIRGWFNLLLVASMVSMQKHSYKAVYMHGFVQDSQGRKMSKSLGNIISPYEVIDKFGADTLRYYMIGGANPGLDINYSFEDMKVKHKNLMVLWNIHKYLIDLANASNINPAHLKANEFSLEEKYMLSKLNSTIEKITKLFEEYKLNEIPPAVEELYLELSRTYIQLIRDRLATGTEKEKKVILSTIYNVLMDTLRLLSPVSPFITEKMFLNLKHAFDLKDESIHLANWPSVDVKRIDEELENNFSIINSIVQSALSAREKIQLGIRWPLREIIVVTEDKNVAKAVEKLETTLKTQINIKEIKVQEKLEGAKFNIRADFKQLGPDFGKDAPKIISKIAIESPETIINHLNKEGKYEITIDGKKIAIVKEHLIVTREVPPPYIESSFRNGLLYLNKSMDDELEAEGFSRELIRRVQSLRKEAGLEKKDRINLFVKADLELVETLKKWESQIQEKVGAKVLRLSGTDPSKKHKFSTKEKVKGKEFEIFLEKV